jgi:rhamnogalacturonan hydrolase
LTFSNWKGTIIDPKRASINIICADAVPCTDINLKDIAFWTDANKAMKYTCQSAYGAGYCLKSGNGGMYTASQTVQTAPEGYKGEKMADDLKDGLGLTVSIDIPKAIPTMFYPGVKAKKPLLNGSGGGAR